MRTSVALAVALCGAALLPASVVVAQTNAMVVTPGRSAEFVPPGAADGQTVVTPGPPETMVNPELRGRRGPSRFVRPRFVVPEQAAGSAAVRPGSRPAVVYPDADLAGDTVVRPGRRPTVIYPP